MPGAVRELVGELTSCHDEVEGNAKDVADTEALVSKRFYSFERSIVIKKCISLLAGSGSPGGGCLAPPRVPGLV